MEFGSRKRERETLPGKSELAIKQGVWPQAIRTNPHFSPKEKGNEWGEQKQKEKEHKKSI